MLLLLTALAFAGKPNIAPLVHEATIDAPASQVWAAFTTKSGIESWMVSHTEIDLRVGGDWKTHYRKDGVIGDEGTIEHKILSFDPERMFSFRTVKAPKGFPFVDAIKSMWTIIYFEQAGANRTKVTTRCLGFNDTEESQKMRGFFEHGNKITLDELVAHFKK